ncbi:MAG: hypothetical protein A2V88_09295 [Elusimicrobia bacterium RBG_16_66_12]|nr:MAG: hypothetical protein A2V88_09295 [Elusimicrobia bacterium RBG_16_66_12]
MEKGALFKNDRGRWEFNTERGSVELSCGSVVEIFAFNAWLRGRIEADRQGYCFLHENDTDVIRDLAGTLARLPEGARARGGMI